MAFSSGETLGGFFVGFTISLFLHGVLIAQVATFYRYHGAGANAITALILVIFALENAHTVFMSIGAWDYMVDLHGDISEFHSPVIALGVLVYIATVCNTLCRFVFSYSIYKLSGRRVLFPAVIIILSIIVMVVSVIYATAGVQQRPWGEKALALCFYLGTASALAADILITVNMIVLFARRGAGFGRHVLLDVTVDSRFEPHVRTDKLTTSLLFYCLNTGVTSSICVIGVLVSYLISPDAFIWMSFYLLLGKVYTNSLLGFLNAREVLFVRGDVNRRHMLQTTTAPQFTSVVTVDRSDTPDSQFYLDAAEDDPRAATGR
ncbi:hypothetical protein V8D89_004751 [Ganoderma adspersum]